MNKTSDLRILTAAEIDEVAGAKGLSFGSVFQTNNIGAIADNGGRVFSLLNLGSLRVTINT